MPASQLAQLAGRSTESTIQVFPADVHGPDVGALRPAPSDLPSNQRSFLEKYQPLADLTSSQIGEKNQAVFTSSGHCFAEFPCFSVERGAMATIGDQEEVSQQQVSAILDRLTSSDTISFEYGYTNSVLSGLKLTAENATLEVVAAHGTMPARFLAGMVFDMYKMQHDDPSTNSIRAVQAKADNAPRPFVALCLYPEEADATQAHNFCIGNELDGTPTNQTEHIEKRFSLEGGFNFLCGLIQIPILCHGADV